MRRISTLGRLLLACALPGSVLATPDRLVSQEAGVEEEDRVTVVDVFVELDAEPSALAGRVRSLPRDLIGDDFEVRIDGAPQPVVGYFDPRRGSAAGTESSVEPWTIVLYFDLELAQRDTVRWAAAELVERLPELVSLGEVEVVVAGGARDRSLAPTRDLGLLEPVLAGMVTDPGGVHGVLELRAEVLNAFEDGARVAATPALVRASIEEEVAMVGDRLDELLIYLRDREARGSKRALFWVTDGFDLEPGRFYRAQGLEVGAGAPSLARDAGALAVALASYGWVTISLSPPAEGPGLVPGFRIGKWLYRARLPPGAGIGGKLVLEERRDPKRARAHLEVGEAHLQAGEAEQAEEAFERALYHFAGDPRTRSEQATAKVGLGRALEAQGADAEARQAFRHAVELDPDLSSELRQARPSLLNPLELQTRAAAASAGRVVRDHEVLVEAVASLSRRARLTYQVSGWPTGRIRRLEIDVSEASFEIGHPEWMRSGDPAVVSAARARRFISGDLDEGALTVRAEVESIEGGGREVVVTLDRSSLRDRDAPMRAIPVRLTVAIGGPGRRPAVQQARLEIPAPRAATDEATSGVWSHRQQLRRLDPEEWLSVVLEDLETGLWGADLVD